MPKSILDPSFRYTPSERTDIRKRFDDVRQKLRAEADRQAKERAEAEQDTKRIVDIFDKRRSKA